MFINPVSSGPLPDTLFSDADRSLILAELAKAHGGATLRTVDDSTDDARIMQNQLALSIRGLGTHRGARLRRPYLGRY
jgi:hypothetical protein